MCRYLSHKRSKHAFDPDSSEKNARKNSQQKHVLKPDTTLSLLHQSWITNWKETFLAPLATHHSIYTESRKQATLSQHFASFCSFLITKGISTFCYWNSVGFAYYNSSKSTLHCLNIFSSFLSPSFSEYACSKPLGVSSELHIKNMFRPWIFICIWIFESIQNH